MPDRRQREFLLSSTEALHLLDCDDSDEDALFDIDVEDEEVLAILFQHLKMNILQLKLLIQMLYYLNQLEDNLPI